MSSRSSPDARAAHEIACVERPDTVEALDSERYMAANPDVARSQWTAAEHFTRWGHDEGRVQYFNAAAVAAMRDAKLARLRFRRMPRVPRTAGQPMDFLTDALIEEFSIPEGPPVSANQYGGPFIAEIAAHPERLCLDIGAGLRHTYAENVVNTEIYPSISTDVLCVGEDLPFADAQFDYVICASVLEHTRRPWDVVREICRVVRPGGQILIDWPFLQGVHGYPHHYFNATPQGLSSLFEESCDVVSSTIEPNNHPMHGLWWTLRTWRLGLAEPDAAALDALTIKAILGAPVHHHLREPYCAHLSDDALHTIPAGSTLVAQRRQDRDASIPSHPATTVMQSGSEGPDASLARIAVLEAEIAVLRASHSWRLTAPLRAIRGIMTRG